MINATLVKVALSVECWQTTGLSKFNISVHGFSFCANVCSRKIALHETISVGANIFGLIYNVLIDIVSLYILSTNYQTRICSTQTVFVVLLSYYCITLHVTQLENLPER